MDYDYVHTIRYMGNKYKLLNYIIPEIEKVTNPGDVVCDIMAGTNSVGYALKKRNPIISNDMQYYSYVIAKFMLGNKVPPTVDEAHSELDFLIESNRKNKYFKFFIENYVDTYFSEIQCFDIDSIRYALDKSENKYFYLVCLMSAMCKAQSTTGHFAQYMSKDHKRIIPLRTMSIYDLFFEKIADFKNFVISEYKNRCYNYDFNILLDTEDLSKVKCFYVDSPYTTDQYSRFYHILETICKYDEPILEHKAKYRNDRKQSAFCYKKTVLSQFERIIEFAKKNGSSVIISYSNHGVVSPECILEIGKKYFKNTEIKYLDFNHSSQGNGTIKICEVIIILKQEVSYES